MFSRTAQLSPPQSLMTWTIIQPGWLMVQVLIRGSLFCWSRLKATGLINGWTLDQQSRLPLPEESRFQPLTKGEWVRVQVWVWGCCAAGHRSKCGIIEDGRSICGPGATGIVPDEERHGGHHRTHHFVKLTAALSRSLRVHHTHTTRHTGLELYSPTLKSTFESTPCLRHGAWCALMKRAFLALHN